MLLAIALISPFVISSLLIDRRGIAVPGHVYSKHEYIVTHYASWTRKLEVTVEYDPPDEPGVAFLQTELAPERFDSLKKGDSVELRYLRREDLPGFPGAHTLRQMRVLPRAHLAGEYAWSDVGRLFETHRTVAISLLCVALVLTLWRLLNIPLFGWAIGACVCIAVVSSLFAEFPRPTPPPKIGVRTASGSIKSLESCEWLFRSTHERGLQADQPIQIAGVQFVPEGRTEPVVAVDLIDAGSIPGLQEHSAVAVDYESASPRVAYLRGASRHFVRRNIEGMLVQGVAVLVVVGALLAAYTLLRRGFRALVRRSPV